MPHKFSHTKFGAKIMKKQGTKKTAKKAPKKKPGGKRKMY
jgi:hypothetical protein